MRVSLVSIALAVAVAGCASDEASVRLGVEDEMRVHGHDLVYDIGAGESFLQSLVADVPGIFEVDVHGGHDSLDTEVRD